MGAVKIKRELTWGDARKRSATPKPPTPLKVYEGDQGISLMELPHAPTGRCRWPLGDPLKPGFSFCGKRCEGTYCRGHDQLAWLPESRSRDFKRNTDRALVQNG